MATINTFKEIRAWQYSKDLSVDCYKMTQEAQFKFEFALVNQLRKCAISVPSNIAEGFERKGNKEFVQFLFIAAGSLGELQCLLIISQEIGFIETIRLTEFEARIETIKKMIYGLVTHLKSSEQKGYKFSEPEAPYGYSKSMNNLTVDELPLELKQEADRVWDEYKSRNGNEYSLESIDLSSEFISEPGIDKR